MTTVVHPLQVRSLKSFPILQQNICCDLKRSTESERWWVCRKPVGSTPHRIIIEKYNDITKAWEQANVFTD